MYLRQFSFYDISRRCVSLNYVPEAESDDLLCSGCRGVPGRDPGHHRTVRCQVESPIQDEENSKTFRGQTGPSWRRQGETQETL